MRFFVDQLSDNLRAIVPRLFWIFLIFFRFGKFVNIHQPGCTCTGSSISIIDFGMARPVLMNDQSSKIKCRGKL